MTKLIFTKEIKVDIEEIPLTQVIENLNVFVEKYPTAEIGCNEDGETVILVKREENEEEYNFRILNEKVGILSKLAFARKEKERNQEIISKLENETKNYPDDVWEEARRRASWVTPVEYFYKEEKLDD